MAEPRIAGFTLIEALIIMVIVGIVSATAYPLARNAVIRSNVHGARSHAVTLFSLARATAQETGRTTTLAFTGNAALITATPRLVTLSGSTLDTIIGTPVNFNTNYGVTVSGTPAATLTVDSRGLSSSGATTIRFVRSGISDSMIVTGLGRVTR